MSGTIPVLQAGRGRYLSVMTHCLQSPRAMTCLQKSASQNHDLKTVFCRWRSPSLCSHDVTYHLSKNIYVYNWGVGEWHLVCSINSPRKTCPNTLLSSAPPHFSYWQETNVWTCHHWSSSPSHAPFSPFPHFLPSDQFVKAVLPHPLSQLGKCCFRFDRWGNRGRKRHWTRGPWDWRSLLPLLPKPSNLTSPQSTRIDARSLSPIIQSDRLPLQ